MLRLLERLAATVTTPAAGARTIFIDTAGSLGMKDSTGAVTTFAPGGVATDSIWDAAGDLLVGTGANTAARLAIGANTYVLTSNGTTATWAAATGGHTIEDEGTPVTQRATLNFVGDTVAVTDAGGKTVVTLSAQPLSSDLTNFRANCHAIALCF